MFIIRKKNIYIFLVFLAIFVASIEMAHARKELAQETVALRVNNKKIILDAGHGRRRWSEQQLVTYQRQILI